MMMSGPALEPCVAESLGGLWSTLHRDAPLAVRESELHYLKMLAFASDDDLLSHLLLRKLRLAQVVDAGTEPASLVVMNAFLEFRRDGGDKRFGQLVHPSARPAPYTISILSLLGAGLIGLRAGQTILWPDDEGGLRDLEVLHVENCPGLGQWLGAGLACGAANA